MENFTRGLEPKAAMKIGHSKEISQIIKGVLDMNAVFFDDPNGPYSMTCPFCSGAIKYGGYRQDPTMEELPHSSDCIWVIAKRISGNPERENHWIRERKSSANEK